MNAIELRKYFKPGDHVKIIDGKLVLLCCFLCPSLRYEGDTGLIVKTELNEVVIFSDLTNDEIKCRPRDVQLCAQVSSGVDSLGKYQFHVYYLHILK